jgi:pimeloyl-ACP methyl ester carboxylesterase
MSKLKPTLSSKLGPKAMVLHAKFLRALSGMRLHHTKGGLPYLKGPERPNRPTLLWLHGFGDNKDGALYSMPLITRHFNLIAPDLPGFGDNPKNWDQHYDLKSMAFAIEKLCRELALDCPLVLGNSLGGAVALELVTNNQEAFSGLALIDSAGFFYPDIPSLFHAYLDGHNIFEVNNKEDYQLLLSKILAKPERIPGPIFEFLYEQIKGECAWFSKMMGDLIGSKGRDTTPSEIEQLSFNQKVKGLTLPTLIVWGEKDGLFPVEIASIIHRTIPGSVLKIFENTGHAPQFERPLALSRVVVSFARHKGLIR